MRRDIVKRTWLVGLVFFVAGLVVAGIGVGLMLGHAGTWVSAPSGGVDFQPTLNAFFWSTVATTAFGGLLVLTGGILQFAAWIGALITTSRAVDKTWFVVLLVLGLLGLQFVVMIVYLVAGPDDAPRSWSAFPQPPPLAPPPPIAPPQPPAVRTA